MKRKNFKILLVQEYTKSSPRVVLLVQDRDEVQIVPVRVSARLVVQRRDHHDARLLLDADGDSGAGKAAAEVIKLRGMGKGGG